MCLIIVKPKGVELPLRPLLKTSWINNPDGFGLAYNTGHSVVIIKGAMRWRTTKKLLAQVPTPKDRDMVLHFRQATEGKICPQNCHPFPISKDKDALQATRIVTDLAIAHNGIIWDNTMLPSYTDKVKQYKVSQHSDTQRFVRKTLARMGTAILNRGVQDYIVEQTTSVYALITPTQVMTMGKFVSAPEAEGCSFSNHGYAPITYKYKDGDDWAATSCRTYKTCELCGAIVGYTFKIEDMNACWTCYRAFADIDDDGTP